MTTQQPFLTVGMATYDEFDSTWHTVNNLRLQLQVVLPGEYEIVVVDNHPGSKDSARLGRFMKHVKEGRLVTCDKQGTASRNLVFANARGTFTLCVDCHVLLSLASVGRLVAFLRTRTGSNDLFQGTLVHDDMTTRVTHMNPEWRAKMFGTWGLDSRVSGEEPFEIPSQGLGLFCCRTAAWPGFNPLFRGFGGEEGYIHRKFQKMGGKCWCLPWLEWLHKFRDGVPTPYPNKLEDRIFNYYVGWYELGEDDADITKHFSANWSPAALRKVRDDARAAVDAAQSTVQPVAAPKPAVAVAEALVAYLLELTSEQRQATLQELHGKNPELHAMTVERLRQVRLRATAGPSQRRRGGSN